MSAYNSMVPRPIDHSMRARAMPRRAYIYLSAEYVYSYTDYVAQQCYIYAWIMWPYRCIIWGHI